MLFYLYFQHLALFALYLVLFFISLFMYFIDFGTDGTVVYNETKQWNLAPITSVSSYEQCPNGTETLSFEFLGTNEFCYYGGLSYEFG